MNDPCVLHQNMVESLERQGKMLSEIHSALLGNIDGKKGLVSKVEENSEWIKGKETMMRTIISRIIIAVLAAAVLGGGSVSLFEKVFK